MPPTCGGSWRSTSRIRPLLQTTRWTGRWFAGGSTRWCRPPTEWFWSIYKTDRVEPGQVAARAELYRPQVAGYREAVERITGRPVAASYLVFLTAREVVAL